MLNPSLFQLPPLPDNPAADEVVEVLAEGPDCRIERIVSFGRSSPPDFWYDQKEDEWVTLLQGRAVLDLKGRTQTLHTGEQLLIPARRRHRVAYTSAQPPCIWLCVFGRLK
ncbi:MAG: cupin domain-containing protein [Clostridiales bacterium]|nr:cupin domain-containing protein [Clostridiales bacterium]